MSRGWVVGRGGERKEFFFFLVERGKQSDTTNHHSFFFFSFFSLSFSFRSLAYLPAGDASCWRPPDPTGHARRPALEACSRWRGREE